MFHQHAFASDCLLAANQMTLKTTAMTPFTLQHLLSSQRPQHRQPLSPFCLSRQGSRPKKKSNPVGWPYSLAYWLLVGSVLYLFLTVSIIPSHTVVSNRNLILSWLPTLQDKYFSCRPCKMRNFLIQLIKKGVGGFYHHFSVKCQAKHVVGDTGWRKRK